MFNKEQVFPLWDAGQAIATQTSSSISLFQGWDLLRRGASLWASSPTFSRCLIKLTWCLPKIFPTTVGSPDRGKYRSLFQLSFCEEMRSQHLLALFLREHRGRHPRPQKKSPVTQTSGQSAEDTFNSTLTKTFHLFKVSMLETGKKQSKTKTLP